jgi:hypothetical protein
VVRAVSLPLSLLLRSAAAGGDFALKKTWGGSEPERLDGAIAGQSGGGEALLLLKTSERLAVGASRRPLRWAAGNRAWDASRSWMASIAGLEQALRGKGERHSRLVHRDRGQRGGGRGGHLAS